MKAELSYTGMRVKELSKLSGVKKTTIDSYLKVDCFTPSVDSAVRIAEALEVSVEYLVKGEEAKKGKSIKSLGPDLRSLLEAIGKLNPEDRKIVVQNTLNLIEALAKRTGNVPAGKPRTFGPMVRDET